MPQFLYQVRDSRGAAASGTLNAASPAEASRTLRGEGNVIVDLREHIGADKNVQTGQVSRKRAKRDDVIFFANQLAVMVDTGVPLPDALDGIARQTQQETLQSVLEDLSEQVKAGVDFSAALAQYPKIFSPLFVSMVRASEASGTMGKMLQRISKYLEKQRQIRKRVTGAVIYPVAMLGFCVVVITCMIAFVLPRFEKIYAGRSSALPAPTRILLGMSGFVSSYWLLILGGLAAVGVGAYLFLRTPDGKIFVDRIRISMPIIGSIYRRASIARSLRTLATMISTGVSTLESMEITADVSGNIFFRRIWTDLGAKLTEGASMSEEMATHHLIPPCVPPMVAAGEQTGKLGTVLERVAAFCEEDLDTTIRTATSMIEPVMIITMGIMVGGIAMALLLPIFSLSKVVAG